MNAEEFFYQNIGKRIGVKAGCGVKSVQVPQRVKVGVKQLALGQMDCFYIACATEPSQLIGRIEPPAPSGLDFVGTESISARRHIADWLIHSAKPPFITGVIGKAHPEPSFRLSKTLVEVYFCDTAGGFVASVDLVRKAHEKIRHLEWKKVVAPAIHTYHDYLIAPLGENAREKNRLQKLLDKTPEMSVLLPSLGIRPGSGEYAILSWSNIERKQD
jgi:hypothetical protein